MKRTQIVYLGALCALALAACGDDDTPDSQDATSDTDVTTDVTPDTTTDGASDATDTVDPTDGSAISDGGDPTDGSGGGSGDYTQPESPDLTLNLPGMIASAGVYFDERGVLHAACATTLDCMEVMGYFHARDRFAQMDLRRRVVTGRLTQLVGELGLDNAISNRQLYSTREGVPLEESALSSASPEVLAELEAYSRGVNAWLDDLRNDRNGAALSDEYEYPLVNSDNIPDWTPSDSIATILALVESLTNQSSAKISNGRVASLVDDETFFDLYGNWVLSEISTYASFEGDFTGNKGNFRPMFALPSYLTPSIAPVLDRAYQRIMDGRIDDTPREPGQVGSNNWVVAPDQTAGGYAILANDPHLTLSNPSIWYLADIDTSGDPTDPTHSTGVTFAGIPWVVLGQNDNVAWGATTTYLDQTDVYLETLTEDGSGVVFDGADVTFIRKDLVFDMGDGTTETREALWVPHHGPVLSIDEDAGTAVSLRWSGHDISTDINVLHLMARASTVADIRTALGSCTTIGQNWITIDTEGSIGWFPYNRIPDRTWASADTPSWAPVPGDGSNEWDTFWDYDDLPQAYNPEAGMIATANNDMTGAMLDGDIFNDGYSPIQFQAAPGIRQERIVESLRADAGNHTPESMSTLQSDTLSIAGRQTVAPMLALLADDAVLSADAQNVATTLENWAFTCPTGLDGTDAANSPASADADERAEAAGCMAFTVLLSELRLAQYADEVAAGTLPSYPGMHSTVRLLTDPDFLNDSDRGWDNVDTTETTETSADIALVAIEATAAWLVENFSDDPDTWLWGREHTVTLRADLLDAAGVELFNNGPYANDGAMWTVDVAQPRNPSARDFSHLSGPSMRFVCEGRPEGMTCTMELPGGQRHFRDDATYDVFLDDWLNNRPWALLRGPAAVAADAIQTVRVNPAQ
jgi:penicillin amidase